MEDYENPVHLDVVVRRLRQFASEISRFPISFSPFWRKRPMPSVGLWNIHFDMVDRCQELQNTIKRQFSAAFTFSHKKHICFAYYEKPIVPHHMVTCLERKPHSVIAFPGFTVEIHNLPLARPLESLSVLSCNASLLRILGWKTEWFLPFWLQKVHLSVNWKQVRQV